MFGVRALCDHILDFRHQHVKQCFLESSNQRHRPSRVGCRWALKDRTLQARCSGAGSNSGCSVRAAAVTSTTHAQVTCDSSSVQHLLAQVVQKRSRRVQQQLHKQEQSADQHAMGHQDVPDAVLVNSLDQDLRQRLAVQSTQHHLLEQQQMLQLQRDQWQLLDSYHVNHTQRQRHHLHHHQQQDHQTPEEHWPEHTSQQSAAAVQPDQHVLHISTAGHQTAGTDGLQHQQQQHDQQKRHQKQKHQQQQQSWHIEHSQAVVDQQVDLLLQECASLLDVPQQQQQQPPARSRHRIEVSGPGWNRQELLQGWRHSPKDQVDRTAAGTALMRLNCASQPSRVAKKLLMWLSREQQVVLSAAGTNLAYQALQCLLELQLLLVQQQPHCRLLCTVEVRSSSRPEGRGRCDVYNITCRLLESSQQQQPTQQQLSASARWRPGNASRRRSSMQHRPGLLQQARPHRHQQQVQHQQHHHYQQQNLSHVADGALVSLRSAVSGDAGAAHGVGHLQQPRAALDCSSAAAWTDTLQQQEPQHQPATVLQQSSSMQVCLQTAMHFHNARHHQLLQSGHGSSSSNSQQQSHIMPKVLQQRRCEQQHCPGQRSVTADLSASDLSVNVQQVQVKGSPSRLADAIDSSLQDSAVALLRVAYPKHAAKLLQAAALLNRSWHAQQQQQVATGSMLQPMLQVWPAVMQLQSGSKRGLHVFVVAAPLVQ